MPKLALSVSEQICLMFLAVKPFHVLISHPYIHKQTQLSRECQCPAFLWIWCIHRSESKSSQLPLSLPSHSQPWSYQNPRSQNTGKTSLICHSSSHDVLILSVCFNHTRSQLKQSQTSQNACLTMSMEDVQSLRSIRPKRDKLPSVEISFSGQTQPRTVSFSLKQVCI